MLLLIIIFPFLGFLSATLGGRFFGFKGASIITCGLVFMSVVFSYSLFFFSTLQGLFYSISGSFWMTSEWFFVRWGFIFDSLTVSMFIVVTTISFLVHLYSLTYMEHDPHLVRFLAYLGLFTFFMLVLVSADNLSQLFVGWEGVGLVSYLLINFWFTRHAANKAAMKAMIVNKVGDIAYVLGLVQLFYLTQSTQFAVLYQVFPCYKNVFISFFGINVHACSVVTLCFFFGAVGKSAQIGLHTWLTDAMEGPTPVSALIHAATMVTAGVFLILRCSLFFEFSSVALLFASFFGGTTAFFAATCGLFQNDVKKVIAYSTCSQLGYMVFACGLSHYQVAFFHLVCHAFFKALLFLAAGSAIHAFSDDQDVRKMGGVLRILPLTYVFFIVGSLSLMGFPFLSGFYSKDLILEVAASTFFIDGFFVYWLGVLSALLTAFYSFRLIYLAFIRQAGSHKSFVANLHEPSFFMLFPMVFLSVFSVLFGYASKDFFVGMGSPFFFDSIYNSFFQNQLVEYEYLSVSVKNTPVICSIFGAFAGLFLYSCFSHIASYFFLSRKWFFFLFFSQKWFFDQIYSFFIVHGLLRAGYSFAFNVVDRGVIEYFGPFFFYKNTLTVALVQRFFFTGYLYHYFIIYFSALFFFIFNFSIWLFFNPDAYFFLFFFVFFVLYNSEKHIFFFKKVVKIDIMKKHYVL
jgi:proton-translocating NADH-quinone oxidoreductase chain L